MGDANQVFIYLFLVRFVTTILIGKQYFNNKSRTNLVLIIACSLYALSAIFRSHVALYPLLGIISAVLAIIGLALILTSILNYVYNISLKSRIITLSIICVIIFTISLFNESIASILVFAVQSIFVFITLIATLRKRNEFKSILGTNYLWYIGVLVTGISVLLIYLIGFLGNLNIDSLSYLFTFVTSLMISIFFIQFEYIQQNKKIEKANSLLKEDVAKEEANLKKMDAMIANISDAISIIDENAIIKYVSPNIEQLFGWKQNELIGEDKFKILNLENSEFSKNDFRILLETANMQKTIEAQHMCKDGTYKQVKMTLINLIENQNINGILINFHDISEQKKLEIYLRNQQILESIGTLAAGVAHEINNPINGIMNYAQILLDSPEYSSEDKEYLKEIVFESERIADIVKNLLEFSRVEDQSHSLVQPKDIIDSTLSLIKTIYRHDQIILHIEVPEGLPEIKCRTQQIQQIIMNLMTNARDALNAKYPDFSDNKICTISCEQLEKDNQQWIRISVKDNGNGISESIREKVFVPFFTTKGRNQGTGLGLSISYRIANEHSGILDYETEIGQYTKFYLDLPIDNGW